MPIGPGKYDHLCTLVREAAQAEGAIVLLLGGPAGAGFSVQAPLEVQLKLPEILETIARQIRADLQDGPA